MAVAPADAAQIRQAVYYTAVFCEGFFITQLGLLQYQPSCQPVHKSTTEPNIWTVDLDSQWLHSEQQGLPNGSHLLVRHSLMLKATGHVQGV